MELNALGSIKWVSIIFKFLSLPILCPGNVGENGLPRLEVNEFGAQHLMEAGLYLIGDQELDNAVLLLFGYFIESLVNNIDL